MPKRTDIKSILIIGAGPIVIGQACEFDYAGTQACKALKEEGYKIILVNSNPATIMTDDDIADITYMEPITEDFLEKIIAKEKPDALLPTLGGQTALNCALQLAHKNILKKYHVELIGASVKAIELAEDREKFSALMKKIGLQVPKSFKINHLSQIKSVLKKLPLPVIVRASYALGGHGAGIANTEKEFISLCKNAFHHSSQQEITIDEALVGYKEFELEVVRDKKDNCIIVSGIENIDPLGVHTGDSITVSPIQTLTDKEYQQLRLSAFNILRAVGVNTGGSNVQFAIHPKTGKVFIIEMNPRVSRSSALVSKATGFPIAKIAAKLAVGYTLDELKNDILGDKLPASFEPTLDYVVVKIPRFNFEKFSQSPNLRGPQMQSVGEVMAIGRTFPESLQKAMRSLELNLDGFNNETYKNINTQKLKSLLKSQSDMQLLAIGEAFRRKMSLEEIAKITHIDKWFLQHIKQIIVAEIELSQLNYKIIKPNALANIIKHYKKLGFSDSRMAYLLKCTENDIYQARIKYHIQPVYKHIDSCSGEFETKTNYLYGTYEKTCESIHTTHPKMLVIGSGPNRIGQGIEFDYCCVHVVKALKKLGFETIMLNCNPETVSTDFDVVDRLYCVPLIFEDILAIIEHEKPIGVFVQYGGQTPLKLAKALSNAGISLVGLNEEIIDITEDRDKFANLVNELKLQQPQNTSVYTLKQAIQTAEKIGYPIIIRPSYVLGGSAMKIVNNQIELEKHFNKLCSHFNLHLKNSVLIEKFLENAIEVDVDAVSDGENVFIPTLLEQIEPAGIHSGDSACITPSVSLSEKIKSEIQRQTKKIALYLKIKGIFNIQYAVKNEKLYLIEVNPRASRTVPFLCKITGLPLIKIATECIFGKKLNDLQYLNTLNLPSFYVKEAVLPFGKFPLAKAMLGPEMKSTGEVIGIGETQEEAFLKAQISAGNTIPTSGNVYLSVSHPSILSDLYPLTEKLNLLGFKIFIQPYPQSKTHALQHKTFHMAKNITDLPKPPSLIIALIDLSSQDSHAYYKNTLLSIRYAVDHKICYVTSLNAANYLLKSITYLKNTTQHFTLNSLQDNAKKINQIQFTSDVHSHPISSVKHLLTGEELSKNVIENLLNVAIDLKNDRKKSIHEKKYSHLLSGKHLALLFSKPSLRTRFSFGIAIRELGGDFIESVESTRKYETPEDHAGVLGGYCHAIMVRTHEDSQLDRMQKTSKVPIINGLSALHHPCQILADILTLHEIFRDLKGLTLSYIGDGNNILHSLLLIAPQLGINIHYCCPPTKEPDTEILNKSLQKSLLGSGKIKSFSSPQQAVSNAHAVYTDVWTSMGFEDDSNIKNLFEGFQVNEELMKHASKNAIFMHCLPMERGNEVNHTLPHQPCSVIYQQSENRLHIQKALLLHLLHQ